MDPRARFGRASAGYKGLAENAPGAQTVKESGTEKGPLPRDPQAPVVALAELLHSSYICQRAPCWASPVQE